MYYVVEMNRHCVIAAGLVTALVAVGCKGPEAQLVGKWKCTDMKLPGSVSSANASMAKSMMSSITLEFKPDKHYTMSVILPIEGTWTISDHTVSMTMTKMMGMDMTQLKQTVQQQAKTNPAVAKSLQQNPNSMDALNKPQTATLSDDGKTLTVKDNSGKGGDMVFTKDTSSS